MKKRIIISFLVIISAASAQANEWTHCYQKKFSASESQNLHNHTTMTFAKDSTMLFNNLLFSWNAFRPQHGFFSFFIQARDASTGKWGAWHMVADWGHGIQRSYLDKTTPSHTEHYHVRLEHKNGHFSDAFRIKVTANDGADLKEVKMLSASVANYERFTQEDPEKYAQLPSVYVSHVPIYSQILVDHPDTTKICSPTSTAMLLSFLTKQPVDVPTFAQGVYDTGLAVYGSWPFNTAHAYDYCKGTVWLSVMRLSSFKMLYARLLRHIPVVVSICGPIVGGATAYAGGHLLLVVGYDAVTKEVICHDPAFDTLSAVVHRYPLADFLQAWEKRRRLAYIAQPVHAK